MLTRCHGCHGGCDRSTPLCPDLWFPGEKGRDSVAIMTHKFCCGTLSHTEPVAYVSAYLRDLEQNVQLLCNAVNSHLLAGRPEPDWLKGAWRFWGSEGKARRDDAINELTVRGVGFLR